MTLDIIIVDYSINNVRSNWGFELLSEAILCHIFIILHIVEKFYSIFMGIIFYQIDIY